MGRIKLKDRKLPDYSRGEEIFNMVSHIVGGGFGVLVLVSCVIIAALFGNWVGVVSGAIYGTTMVLLYTMSSIYHGLKPKHDTAKKVMQIIDHCSIFLLIAGTYTPITLCAFLPANPVVGWVVFGVIWACASLGIVFNSIDLKMFKRVSMILYLAMGWCIVFTGPLLIKVLPIAGLAWLVAGGVAYTIGAVFYSFGKKRRYIHSVFHLFVVVGSILQYVCIILYTLIK